MSDKRITELLAELKAKRCVVRIALIHVFDVIVERDGQRIAAVCEDDLVTALEKVVSNVAPPLRQDVPCVRVGTTEITCAGVDLDHVINVVTAAIGSRPTAWIDANRAFVDVFFGSAADRYISARRAILGIPVRVV